MLRAIAYSCGRFGERQRRGRYAQFWQSASREVKGVEAGSRHSKFGGCEVGSEAAKSQVSKSETCRGGSEYGICTFCRYCIMHLGDKRLARNERLL